MADFRPVSPPVTVHSTAGAHTKAHTVYGWYSRDDWTSMEPVVANPDGVGVGPWRLFYGEDPWKAL